MATLVIFEPTRFFVLDNFSDHKNAAIAAAGDAPSTEALDQFTKLVDRIVHVTCG